MANFALPSEPGGLRQGEILANARELIPTSTLVPAEDTELTVVTHPLLIVLSQDCDLDWDYRAKNYFGTLREDETKRDASKEMSSVLLCIMDMAEAVRAGDHVNRQTWTRVVANREDRYHFLEAIPSDAVLSVEGMPEQCIDFKRYIALSTDVLYKQIARGGCQRKCRLRSPYLEHLSQRFAAYLARVALPEDYKSS